MYPSTSKETMAQYDYQRFEAAPQRLTFHEEFMHTVRNRQDIINRAVARIDRATEQQKLHSEVSPDVSRAFMPFVERHIPMVDARNAIDDADFLRESGTVSLDPVKSNERLNSASETEDDRVREARQHLAYIEALDELNRPTAAQDIMSEITSLSDDNFTLAA